MAIELCGKALNNLELEQDTEFEIRVSRANLYEKRWSYHKDQGTLISSGIFSDIDLAILDWTKAIELDPDYTDGYNSRATVHYLNQNFEEARRDYSEAIDRAPHIALYLKNRAATFEKLNLPDDAEEDRKRAMQLDPALKFDEKVVEEKERSLSMESTEVPEAKLKSPMTTAATVILTPTVEEVEEDDTEIERFSESLSRHRSPEEVSLKTLLIKFRSTVAKTQKLNRDFECKLDALREYYKQQIVKRELMMELLIQKLNSLNLCFKFFLSSYFVVTILDCIIGLSRSGFGFFRDIWNKPKRVVHLLIAIIGMGFIFSENPSLGTTQTS